MRRPALTPLLLLAAVGGCHKQEPQAPQPAAAAPAAPVATADAVTDDKGKPLPKGQVTDLAANAPVELASFKGKPLLLNLWATWCAPCVRELPTLAKLAAEKGDALAVVAVSEDLEGAKMVQPYLAKRKIGIHPYHDPNNALMMQLKEASLPVTILYDADGKEVWRVRGGMDWTSAPAKALLAEAGA
jgi:thiol-disulfide isomerase/thioredoxin